MQLPSQYKPLRVEDFIGPARAQAELITKLVTLAQASRAPLKFLVLGPPGIGKSALSNFIIRLLGGTQWTIRRYNGKDLDIETMKDIAREFQQTSMFDGFRILQWEEVDRMSNDAQVRSLTVLDDLPPGSAVIATSNCQADKFEIRFQRRFKVIELEPPSSLEIHELLLRLGVPPADANQIATFACGCLGQALEDADLAMANVMQIAA